MNIERKYIICCDFDGVLHSYVSGWQGDATVIKDGPVPGAMDWLIKMAHDPRFQIAIYSSRSKSPGGIDAMGNWLKEHLLRTYIGTAGWSNEEASCATRFVFDVLMFPTQKPAASMTIDDRAFHFQGVFPTPEWLLDFQPWTKIKTEGHSWLIPRPTPARIQQIREDFLAFFPGHTSTDHLDSQDAAVGDLLAEIEHLRGLR